MTDLDRLMLSVAIAVFVTALLAFYLIWTVKKIPINKLFLLLRHKHQEKYKL